jgi:hypothetical protein
MIMAFGYGAASVRDCYPTATTTLLTCTSWCSWCADARGAKLIDAYLAEAALEAGLRPAEFKEFVRCGVGGRGRARTRYGRRALITIIAFANIPLLPVGSNFSDFHCHVFKYVARLYIYNDTMRKCWTYGQHVFDNRKSSFSEYNDQTDLYGQV